MNEKFKVLIVEDDIENIKLLTILLDKYCDDISLVGTASNSNQFIDMYFSLQPNILLLDIDIGEEKNTLNILTELGELNCEIIITSSHKKFALKALNQFHVASYIVKPIIPTNLKKGIDTAKHNLILKTSFQRKNDKEEFHQKIIGIPTEKSIDLISSEDILYLEADGKYTMFHMSNDKTKIVSKNIGYYEKILPGYQFYRIHHKYIINLLKVKTISRADGNYCVLNNGKALSIANRRKDKLRKLLYLK